jgi:hypothetical protein
MQSRGHHLRRPKMARRQKVILQSHGGDRFEARDVLITHWVLSHPAHLELLCLPRTRYRQRSTFGFPYCVAIRATWFRTIRRNETRTASESMPIFRCDFDITGDLVLPPKVGRLNSETTAGISFAFTNGPSGADGHASGMKVTVIGPSESIETARDDLQDALANQLNLLTLVTQSRFKIVVPTRLMEWEPGQRRRTLKVFHASDPRHPPDPELESVFMDTVRTLDRVAPPPHVRTALKYFRYGLLYDQPEDQFMQLWLALEIIAENGKDPDPIPIVCEACKANMTCSACGDSPTRVPMAKQAIASLIGRIAGVDAPLVAKRQFKARNGLMHGRGRESIETECEMSLGDLVNELGVLAWHAIMAAIPLDGEVLHLGHRDFAFAHVTMVAAINMVIEHNGDGPHPSDDQMPNPEFTLTTSFRVPGGADEAE